jgi:hypothetical protein
VARYDVEHHDPHPVARAAAIRSKRELDPRTRDDWRRMSTGERLAAAIQLSRTASLIRLRKP